MLSNSRTIITCEIRDEFGHVESASHCDTMIEAVSWFAEHHVQFKNVRYHSASNTYTFQRTVLEVAPAKERKRA